MTWEPYGPDGRGGYVWGDGGFVPGGVIAHPDDMASLGYDVGGMVHMPENAIDGSPPEEIAELMKMITEAGSVDEAMALIQERMHPNGMCGCCGAPNPLGSKLSAKGIPACSMLCAYHLLHPGDIRTPGHYGEPALVSALQGGHPGEDVEPGGSEDVSELRSDQPRQ